MQVLKYLERAQLTVSLVIGFDLFLFPRYLEAIKYHLLI